MQVNARMLNNIIEEEDDCFVFFYEEVDPEAHAILAELEGGNFIERLIFSFLVGWRCIKKGNDLFYKTRPDLNVNVA